MHEEARSALPRDAAALASFLAARGHESHCKVGIELETGVLQGDRPAGFEGEAGIQAFLGALQDEFPEPVREAGNLIALRNERGDSITIEPGGQVELSSAPGDGLAASLLPATAQVRLMARAAEGLGLTLVAGGLQPAPHAWSPWMPKARYAVMREWFASLGEAGHLGHHMMQRTLSLQVSLDYLDAADAAELLELSFRGAAVATAIWAASPHRWAEPEEAPTHQSFRAEAWQFTDPSRQGLIPSQVAAASLEGYAQHVLDAPMMFRIVRGAEGYEHRAQKGASFAEVLRKGEWPDGARVSHDDLMDHLGSIFTDARIKPGLIELRSTDGPVCGLREPGTGPLEDVLLGALGEVPAFWVGLAYDAQARAAALAALRAVTPEQVALAHQRTPREGLRAPWGESTLGALALELVTFAKAGLERRAQAGLDADWTPRLLDPVLARLAAGRSPADALSEAPDRATLIELVRLPR